jgi:hypothetical protein
MNIIKIGGGPRFAFGDPQSKDSPLRPIYGPPTSADGKGRPLIGWVLRDRADVLEDVFEKYDEVMDAEDGKS